MLGLLLGLVIGAFGTGYVFISNSKAAIKIRAFILVALGKS